MHASIPRRRLLAEMGMHMAMLLTTYVDIIKRKQSLTVIRIFGVRKLRLQVGPHPPWNWNPRYTTKRENGAREKDAMVSAGGIF